MHPASLEERREFYQKEFKTNQVADWFREWNSPVVFAVIIGRHTGIYPKRYRSDKNRTILIDEYDRLVDIQRYCTEFLPESVYYDRNVYKGWIEARQGSAGIEGLGHVFGQQLAFDIDPENFDCPIHGSLEEKMNRRQGLSFCRLEFQLAQEEVLDLMDDLARSFSELRLVYSGRGFHLHVLDEGIMSWTRKQRTTLVRSLSRRGYLMDEWVPGGGMRLIRLPYSLNGLVSRVAIPLDKRSLRSFDLVNDPRCIPSFARNY